LSLALTGGIEGNSFDFSQQTVFSLAQVAFLFSDSGERYVGDVHPKSTLNALGVHVSHRSGCIFDIFELGIGLLRWLLVRSAIPQRHSNRGLQITSFGPLERKCSTSENPPRGL
jgi:hypothetical protein